jgi:hypothetical protein
MRETMGQQLSRGRQSMGAVHGNLAEILFSAHTNSCTYLYIAFTFVWGAIVTWIGNKTAEYVPIYKFAGSGNACMGILMMIAAAFGSFSMLGGSQVTRILLLYMTMLLVATILMMAFSGASFFFREQVGEFVYEHWEEDVEVAWPGSWDGLLGQKYGVGADKNYVADLSVYYMMANGMLGWVTILLMFANLNHVHGIVKSKRACENFIETMNICLLPLGLLMILSGQYVAESATLSSAPITAFALCISGVLLVTLSFVGCFGTAADSRGVLSIYVALTFILALFLFSMGMGTLILAEKAKNQIVAKWEEIRLVLPPTFDGKYDKTQFAIFVEGNILMLGYTCVVYGFMIFMLSHAARVLRAKLKVLNSNDHKDELLLEKSDKKSDKKHLDLKSANMMTSMRNVAKGQLSPSTLLKKQWTQKYKEGTAKQKKFIKLGGCVCCLILVSIISIVIASLIFTTYCDKLKLTSEVHKVPIVERSDIAIINNYKKGEVTVSKANFATVEGASVESDENVQLGAGLLTVTEKARSAGKASGSKTADCGLATYSSDGTTWIDGVGGGDSRCSLALDRDLEAGNVLAMKYTLNPQDPEILVGLDVSCQNGGMTLQLPRTSNNNTLAKHPKLSIEAHEQILFPKLSKGCAADNAGTECVAIGSAVSPCQDGLYRKNYDDCTKNVDDFAIEFYKPVKVTGTIRDHLRDKGECLQPSAESTPDCYQFQTINPPTMRNSEQALSLQSVSLFTRAGHIKSADMIVRSGGMNVYSESGNLEFNQLRVEGSATENTMVSLKADLGHVVIQNTLFEDTAVEINALVSKVELSKVAAVAAHGYTPVMIHNDKGSVYLNQLIASSVWVTTVDGAIFSGLDADGNLLKGLSLEASSYRLGSLKVATQKGDVNLRRVSVDGHVQIETVSGDVVLGLLPSDISGEQAFTGNFFFKTTPPYKITIRRGVESEDSIHAVSKDGKFATLDYGDEFEYRGGEMRGSINCAGRNPSKTEAQTCTYLGDIYIEATRGDITVVIGCDKIGHDAKTCEIVDLAQ